MSSGEFKLPLHLVETAAYLWVLNRLTELTKDRAVSPADIKAALRQLVGELEVEYEKAINENEEFRKGRA